MNLTAIIERQRDFQTLCEVDLSKDENRLAETFLFKAIEEIVELRKTFPSALNKWAKTQPVESREELLSELSDVLLFLLNFSLSKSISIEEAFSALESKQLENFVKLKDKKIKLLNKEMIATGKKVGLGGGSLMPKVIIIGQNPGKSLKNSGDSTWSPIPNNGAVAFLKRALKLGKSRLLIGPEDVYFTNIVKEPTEDNKAPSQAQKEYWAPFLEQELTCISIGAGNPLVLAMGKDSLQYFVQRGVTVGNLVHPSYFMRRGFTERQYYEEQLLPNLRRYDIEYE